MVTDPLVKTVASLTYKPGWAFTYVPGDGTARPDMLVIRAYVLHSETLKPVTFEIKRVIPRSVKLYVPTFISWVEDMLMEAEIHEMREFFRYKGVVWDNPHESTPDE